MFRFKLSCLTVAAAFAAGFIVSQASADWTEFSLPNLSGPYAPIALSVLPDGQYIFGMQGAYYQQDAFGSASYTAYSNVSPGDNADPSFIAVWDATHAVAGGGGGFGPSDLYRFNPSSLSAPTFVAQNLSLQNYSSVFRDANSLYVGGLNGTGGTHSIAYVNLNTATTKVIIDDVSTYSGGFAEDAAGNLYVGDSDNGNVYKFTAAQLNLAIAGSPLAITDGTFVHQFSTGLSSLAVDGLGRIWSAGYAANGLEVYDPASGTDSMVIPGLTNTSYIVTTFAVGGQSYVAYADQADFSNSNTAQFYGFEAVPEPGTVVLTLAGLTMLLALCRKPRR